MEKGTMFVASKRMGVLSNSKNIVTATFRVDKVTPAGYVYASTVSAQKADGSPHPMRLRDVRFKPGSDGLLREPRRMGDFYASWSQVLA